MTQIRTLGQKQQEQQCEGSLSCTTCSSALQSLTDWGQGRVKADSGVLRSQSAENVKKNGNCRIKSRLRRQMAALAGVTHWVRMSAHT